MPADLDKNNLITQWVNLYTADMLRWAKAKITENETSKDLVQETFLAAFASVENFNHQSNAKTWLFAILNNKIADYYRKAAREAVFSESIDDRKALPSSDKIFDETGNWKKYSTSDLWNDDSNLLDNRAFQKILEQCMEKLPKNWRVCVTSKYLLQKKTSEICQELQITATNYWQVLHRAKLLLKGCIEHNWY
jgi:RNA polymerase sigma-70 factor (TIGR02943 family)